MDFLLAAISQVCLWIAAFAMVQTDLMPRPPSLDGLQTLFQELVCIFLLLSKFPQKNCWHASHVNKYGSSVHSWECLSDECNPASIGKQLHLPTKKACYIFSLVEKRGSPRYLTWKASPLEFRIVEQIASIFLSSQLQKIIKLLLQVTLSPEWTWMPLSMLLMPPTKGISARANNITSSAKKRWEMEVLHLENGVGIRPLFGQLYKIAERNSITMQQGENGQPCREASSAVEESRRLTIDQHREWRAFHAFHNPENEDLREI